MQINFEKVVLHNFMSFGDADITLGYRGYTVVSGNNLCKSDCSGSNGSGKSTIFEAISWCLTGDTIRGAKGISNILMEDGCYVEVFFSVENDYYYVIRSKDSEKYKTCLKVFKNGEDISGKGIKDSEALLKELFPELDSQTLGSVIILGQGLPNRFSNNTPSGRKELLENFSHTDFMICDIKDRVKKQQDTLAKSLSDIENEKKILTALKASNEADISNLQEKLSKIQPVEDLKLEKTQLTDTIPSTEEQIRLKRNEIESLTASNKERIERIADYSSQIEVIKKSIADSFAQRIDALISKLNDYKVKLSSIAAEITKRESITDVCPTCGQKIVGVIKLPTAELYAEVDSIRPAVETLTRELAELNSERDKKVQESVDGYNQEVGSIRLGYSTAEKELSTNKELLDRLQDSIATTKNRISQIDALIETHDSLEKSLMEDISQKDKKNSEIDDKILYYNVSGKQIEDRISIVSKISTLANRDFRGVLLNNVIKFVNSRLEEYSKCLFDTNVELRLDGNNLNIYYSDKLYESLSGGERRKVDIIIQLAIRDMMQDVSNFSSNILVMDEIFDNLDSVSCEKVVNLITEKCTADCLYIITHHAKELSIPCDREIVVTKGEDGVSYL